MHQLVSLMWEKSEPSLWCSKIREKENKISYSWCLYILLSVECSIFYWIFPDYIFIQHHTYAGVLEVDRRSQHLGMLRVTFHCISSRVNERMRQIWWFFFNWCHTFSCCLLHFVNRIASTTYSLNPVLSQKITTFTLSLLGCSTFSMDTYAISCAVGADIKDSLLVWILLPLMVSGPSWSNSSAYNTWKWTASTNRLSWSLGFNTVFTEEFFYLSLDINECVTNTHRCNLHAECLNTEGSFKCKCKQGYRGSGFDCAGEYHWISGIVLYCFSPIIYGYKAFSRKCHAEQCCNTNQARPVHKTTYWLYKALHS